MIRPDSNVRALLPVEVLFRSPIRISVKKGDQADDVQLVVEADKRLNITRSELVNEEELQRNNGLLYRNDLELLDHQRLLKNELLHVDEQRRELKIRITAEGEASKKERRSADRRKINGWKRRDEQLSAYRTEIRNKLGDIKEAIKQQNIANSGRVVVASSVPKDTLAEAFMETAKSLLPETQYHQILQLAEGRLRCTDEM